MPLLHALCLGIVNALIAKIPWGFKDVSVSGAMDVVYVTDDLLPKRERP